MAFSDDFKYALQRRGWSGMLVYAAEAFGLLIVFTFFRLLPLDAASAVGGFIGRHLGPRLPLNQRVRTNLSNALPDLRSEEREKIALRMWDNLGRVMAEFPHLHEFKKMNRITVKGLEHVERFRDDNIGGVFVGGHLGNWELSPIASAMHGVPMAVVYRNPNNPFVAAMLDQARRAVAPWRMPKGAQGGLALARHLKKGGHLGILVDQKMNEGLRLKFFGRDAMTTPAAASWALRMKLPVVITRVKRLQGAHFEVSYEPIDTSGDDTPENLAAIMQRINDRMEATIRDVPSQWLWVHRRWVED